MIAAAVVGLSACSSLGEAPLTPDPRAGLFDEIFTAYESTGRFSGVVLAAEGDELIFVKAYGLANRESETPNRIDTVFDPGSVAKPFLTVIILSLVEDKVVSLDDSPMRYIRGLDPLIWGDVTIGQLLSHTAGVIDHVDADEYFAAGVNAELSRDELLAFFRGEPLLFEPGSQYRYSNFGYSLLAMIAEAASKVTYPELLEERVFKPAGMTDSTWGTSMTTGGAKGYVREFGGATAAGPYSSASASIGAGDIVTTAMDLWRFDRALSEGALLRHDTITEMIAPHAEGRDRGRAYGYGWEIYDVDGSHSEVRRAGHAGMALHMTAVIERDLKTDGFFAILSNTRDSDDIINNVPPPLIRAMQSDARNLLASKNVSLPRSSLVEAFLVSRSTQGFEAAFAEMQEREITASSNWSFSPNEVVLAVVGDLWGDYEKCERLTLYAIERSSDPWLLYETLGDVRSAAGDAEGALAAYRKALQDMPDREYLLDSIASLEARR